MKFQTKIPYLGILLLVYAWFVLYIQQGELLYTIHNFTPWSAEFSHPGGVREWIGEWMALLCRLPLLGSLLYIGCWGLSATLLVRSFKLQGFWSLWPYVAVIALLASITDLGYWIFCLKAPAYWFGPTVGLLLSSFMVWLCSLRPHWSMPALCLMIGMPLLGWYGTMAAIVVLLIPSLRRPVKQWIYAVASLFFAFICMGSVYMHSVNVHWREPLFWYGWHRLQNPEGGSLLLEVPFWVMAGCVLLLPVVARMQRLRWAQLLPILSVVVALCGANLFNYRNENFHTELKMLQALEDGRWREILTLMNKKNPTREMVIMKDVALAQLGQLGNRAFDYPVGGSRPQMNIDMPIRMAHSATPYFYYWSGIPNFAFDWGQENITEYGLSPFYLKLIYRSTLAIGEEVTANRYLTLIRQLPFYSDYDIPAKEPDAVRRFMTTHDRLSNDRGFSENFLLEHLSNESYDTPEAQQIAVHWSILARDYTLFHNALARYLELTGDSVNVPKYFNEKTFDWYFAKETGRKTY